MSDTTRYPTMTTRRVKEIKESLKEVLNLGVWSNKWSTEEDSGGAIEILLNTDGILFDGKIVRTHVKRTGWGLNIQFLSYSDTTCFEIDISLKDKICWLSKLLPYGAGCPHQEVGAKMYLAMLDLLCAGLRVTHCILSDNATVNLTKSKRATGYVRRDEDTVPLTIITMILKGEPYYAQYGYVPYLQTEINKLNELKSLLAQNIKLMDIPKELKKYVGKNNFRDYGKFLEAFILKKKFEMPSKDVSNYVAYKFRFMPRPTEFVKTYNVLPPTLKYASIK